MALVLPGQWALVDLGHGRDFVVRLRTTNVAEIRAALDRNDPAGTVTRLVDGWRDLVDDEGAPFYFTTENLAVLVRDDDVVEAILRGIVAKVRMTRERLDGRAARAMSGKRA